MNGFAYVFDGGHMREVAIEAAQEANAGFVWTHLSAANDQARSWLGEVAGLPDYVIDALTAAETRPRCEAMADGAFINLRGLSESGTSTEPLASVRIFARAGRVYSVNRHPLNALDDVRATVEAGDVHDPGDLIAEFAVAITEQLDPVVADLGDQLDACEEALEANRAFELRRLVTRVRVEAIGCRRFLYPQRAALERLGMLAVDWLQDDDRQRLATAADRAARMAEEVDQIRERAGLMHETLTDLRAELIDQRSLVIAIAAMVFLPLTFITGLYGMNVKGLWFAEEPWAFDAIAAFCLVIAAAITGYFKWKHWTR